MPAMEKPTLFARLLRTTMTDLFHGRLSDGRPPAAVIADSGLDSSTQQLIAQICKRTRLWKRERTEVARELVAHFADAKDAGVPSDMAIRDFGDPGTAAKLIRRAKRRNRSLLWHALRFLRRAAGVLVLIYIGLAVYFSLGKPRVSVDYLAQINEPILKIPREQRAWPYYIGIGEAFDAEAAADPRNRTRLYIAPNVSDRKWPAVVAWLQSHPQMLLLADEATSRPSMGFVYGPEGSVREIKQFAGEKHDTTDPFYKSLLTVLMPQLNSMRATADMLGADARLAAEQKDADRWLKRIDQMRIVGEHSADSGFVVSHLVNIGIQSLRINQIQRMLAEHTDLLSDKQLAELAHQSAAYRKPSDLMSFHGEEMMFKDILQRISTDDGRGDAYISTRGLTSIQNFTSSSGPPSSQGMGADLAKFSVSPAAALLMASRKDLLAKYEYFTNKMERNIDVPWRERRDSPIDNEIVRLKRSTIDRFRYLLLTMLLPSLDRASLTAERFLTQRDATQVGIALELYRRRNGAYPAALSDLSPMLLPSVPLDPVDGKPMKYKLADGKPLVYSIGTDLDDDGGVLPVAKPGTSAARSGRVNFEMKLAIGSNATDYDGDWILYPEPKQLDPDSEEEDTAEPATEPAA